MYVKLMNLKQQWNMDIYQFWDPSNVIAVSAMFLIIHVIMGIAGKNGQ